MADPVIIEREDQIQRCGGCGGWITAWRLARHGCTTCRLLALAQTPDTN